MLHDGNGFNGNGYNGNDNMRISGQHQHKCSGAAMTHCDFLQ
jgi:hypothetical protein